MNERSRLQRLTGRFSPQTRCGQRSQFLIDDREERFRIVRCWFTVHGSPCQTGVASSRNASGKRLESPSGALSRWFRPTNRAAEAQCRLILRFEQVARAVIAKL